MSILMAVPSDVPFNPHHHLDTFPPLPTPTYTPVQNEHRPGDDGPPKKKRRKVNHACLYCRRSHMVCSESRPCQRCIKREIAHLCRDEVKPVTRKASTESATSGSNLQEPLSKPQPAFGTTVNANANTPAHQSPFLLPTHQLQPSISPAWSHAIPQDTRPGSLTPGHPFAYQPDSSASSDFSALGTANFLDGLDDRSFFAAQQAALISSAGPSSTNLSALPSTPFFHEAAQPQTHLAHPHAQLSLQANVQNAIPHASNPFEVQSLVPPGSLLASGTSPMPTSRPTSSSLPEQQHSLSHHHHNNHNHHHHPDLHHRHSSASIASLHHRHSQSQSPSSSSLSRPQTSTASLQLSGPEHFIWTAASSQASPISRKDEALANVIRSKYEAGLLVPFDYDQGYARLGHWMETNVSLETKQQINETVATLRSKCQAIAQNLSNVEHIYIEEQFERMQFEYDRVFSAMGVPACLWRPTGELYKVNREFAQLVGVEVDELVHGRTTIYELMSEDSTLNFWEKYSQVALDAGQKAVLTSCVLKFGVSTPQQQQQSLDNGISIGIGIGVGQQTNFVNCCFSFTIRRDPWGVPVAIVGNFIPY